MSKIIELEIKNFRNIAHEIIDLKGGKSLVITGKNEVGKTNRITAILWLLAGVLFDGTAKDNLSNLIPENVDYGTTVSVKATFDDGQSVEKTYTKPYFQNEFGDWIPKDSVTKYITNGGKPLQRVSDGIAFVYKQLGLEELQNKFNGNKALKPINLAYLLLTTIGIRGLDNATMRALIIDIVGDVSAIEMAESDKATYGVLLPLLKQSNGDINKIRDDLRFSIQDSTNGLEYRVAKMKDVIEELELQANAKIDDVENANAIKSLEELNDKIAKLEVKKQSIQSGATDKIDLEISQLETKRVTLQNAIREQYNQDLIKSRDVDLETQVTLKEQAYQSKVSSVRVVESELSSEKLKLSSLESTKTFKNTEIETIRNDVKQLGGQYEEISKVESTSKIFVTCPHCDNSIDISETKEHKAILEQRVAAEQKKIMDKRDTLKTRYDELKLEVIDIDLRITKQQAVVNAKTSELTTTITTRNTLEQELVAIRKQLSDKTSATKPILNLETPEVISIQSSIERLRTQKNTVLENVGQAITDVANEIIELQNQKPALEVILDKKRVQQANLNSLAPKRVEHERLSNELTATKELYALSKHLLVATFKELERRIELKFGDDVYFKLYEPNASDSGATFKTSICEMYVKDGANRLVPALANGVSTSMQEVRIVEFIERLKAHYNVCDSIILIDRLESLDETKVKMLAKSNNQIITTAVRNTDNVMYELL